MSSVKRSAPSSTRVGTYSKLLVPLDGSRLSESAIPHAAMLALALKSEVVLFRVVEQVSVGAALTGHEGPETVRKVVEQAVKSEGLKTAAAGQYLERHARNYAAHGVKVTVATAVGKPRDQILAYCKANQVDLVVMTTRGRSGLKRLVLGSVAEAVVRSPVVPVLVIRGAA